MRTVDTTIALQYATQNGQRQRLTGDVSGSMLEVQMSELQGVPSPIDVAMAAEANLVDQIHFESQVVDPFAQPGVAGRPLAS